MKISKTTGVWLSAIVVVVALSSGQRADAQVLITGRTAADNAASAGGRSPGDLATAGVGRAIQAARDGRSVHTISEQEDTSTGPGGQFVATAGSTLITQVFDFFFFFINRLLGREGLSPIFPDQLTTPTTGGTPTPGDTGGTGDTTGTGDPTDGGTGDTTGTGEGDTTGVDTGDTTETEDAGTTGGRGSTRKTARGSGS